MKQGSRPLFKILLVLFFGLAFFTVEAKTASAAAFPFEVAGWIPYWRSATGTADAIAHISTFKEISPFGYTVKTDGTLFDAMDVNTAPWPALIKAAQAKKVRVIPTVMWSNTDAIDAVLRDPKLRKAHIAEIVKTVSDHGFDGIDIDYEGKKAETKKYFSLFLKELYAAMGKKWVICTIEARTPLDSRFSKIPKDIEYANDFVAINNYCDRVRIMAYDQGTIDLKLNDAAPGPYIPVADPKWVEKVIKLAAQSIAKKKIVIGVPTYGYEFEVTPLMEGYRYDLLWAFNQKYALDLAKELNLFPRRNVAGEMSFMYVPTTAMTSPPSISNRVSLRVLWWSDAKAIRDKVLLAKKLGVRGVAVFKIDGGEDPLMWNMLK